MKKTTKIFSFLFFLFSLPLLSQTNHYEQQAAFSDKLLYVFGGIMFALLILWAYKVMRKKK